MINLLSKRAQGTTGAGEAFDISQEIAQAVQPLAVKVAALQKANNYLVRANKVKPRLRIPTTHFKSKCRDCLKRSDSPCTFQPMR